MTDLLRDSFSEATQESRQQIERMQAVTVTITNLEPPREFMELHDHLLSILREIDDVKRNDPQTLADSTARIVELRGRLCLIRQELDQSRAQPYPLAISAALDARIEVADKTAERVQQPLRHQSEALKKLRVPQSWRHQHEPYVVQFEAYLGTLQAYYNVTKNGSPKDAERMAGHLADQQRKVEILVDQYRTALMNYSSGLI